MARYKIVTVVWGDAWSSIKSRYTTSELTQTKAHRVISIGYMIRNDSKCVILAHRKQLKSGEWKGITYIPRVCIRKVSTYRRKPGYELPVCGEKRVYSCP